MSLKIISLRLNLSFSLWRRSGYHDHVSRRADDRFTLWEVDMRRGLQKGITVISAAAMAATILAGCGNSGSGAAATTSGSASAGDTAAAQAGQTEVTAAAEESTTGTTATEDQIGKPNGGDTVTLWHYFEGEADALYAMVKKYNESQSDIYIVPTFVSREELMKQYTIGAVSGDLPDIGMCDSPDMASYISLGVFADINDELAGWSDIDQFYPGPLSSCKGSDGDLYGLPNNSNCLALLCNMDMLKAAGVEKAPTTWEELEDACAKVSDPDNGVYGLAISAISNEEGTFQFIPWLYSAGGSVADVSSAESVRAFSYLAELESKGYMSNEVVNWGQGDALNAWAAQKAAMVESGTWQIAQNLDNSLKDTITWNYQYVEMPSENGHQATVIGGENFGVCSSSKHVKECAEFLKNMMSAQNNADWCEIAGKLPVRADAVELKDFWTADERYKVFNDSMNFAVARGPHAQWPTISEAIWTAEQAAILQQSSPEDAAKTAAATIDPILKDSPLPTADNK